MADANIHENQAKHNFSLLKYLKKTAYWDWQITLAFYTAVHIIDCNLEKAIPGWKGKYMAVGLEEGWYAARNQGINAHFKDIFNNYRMLKEKSIIMRYLEAEAANKKAVDAIKKEDAKALIDNNLLPILKRFKYFW